MERPAGIRATNSESRDRPVITRWRKTPSTRSVVPAEAPSVAAMMNPKSAIAFDRAEKTLGLPAGP